HEVSSLQLLSLHLTLRTKASKSSIASTFTYPQWLRRKTTRTTTPVEDQQVQQEAGIKEIPAGIISSQDIPRSTCLSTFPVLYVLIASVQTRHPAEADGIYHAAKQVQDDVVCYQGAFTWPISSSQHWKPSLLYTSQCGVFNLE
ncbi:hypothetical protein IAQ61_008978, partial [Plenodomus lingam]|uniref:uncharacterized protein n=1 Tax=Leptosphaeria maculans TaxID=5022 RepID=UPI003328F009